MIPMLIASGAAAGLGSFMSGRESRRVRRETKEAIKLGEQKLDTKNIASAVEANDFASTAAAGARQQMSKMMAARGMGGSGAQATGAGSIYSTAQAQAMQYLQGARAQNASEVQADVAQKLNAVEPANPAWGAMASAGTALFLKTLTGGITPQTANVDPNAALDAPTDSTVSPEVLQAPSMARDYAALAARADAPFRPQEIDLLSRVRDPIISGSSNYGLRYPLAMFPALWRR